MGLGQMANTTATTAIPARAKTTDGDEIAYFATPQTDASKPVGVVFLTGFRSDMFGTKAVALENWCKQQGRQFLRFDYTGHGQSSGRFEDGTISAWTRDAVFAIENLIKGPVVLVGSSMGGWIMLLAALKVASRIKGLVGLAAAPDFTQDMMERELTDAHKLEIEKNGRIEIENCYAPNDPYIITKALIDDGRNNLLLQGPINVLLPVRLIQGMKDADVPWKTALRIGDNLVGDDVEIQFVKNGNHRLSDAPDIKRMLYTLNCLLEKIEEEK